MAIPSLPQQMVAPVSGLIARFITDQRNRYASLGVPLSEQQKAKMAGFFSPQLLADTRLAVLRGKRVSNPGFYLMLRGLGFQAITFSETVVSHMPVSNELLFHELVHVEQYRQLGIPKFADLYLRGFLNGGGYHAIPLEQIAYSLGAEYEKNPTRSFSVAEIVARCLAEGKF